MPGAGRIQRGNVMRLNIVFVLAVVLAVAGCSKTESTNVIDVNAMDGDLLQNTVDTAVDNAIDNATAPANAMENAAGNAHVIRHLILIDCPILHRRTTEAQCASVTEQAAALEQGVGAFAAPPNMVVGQTEDVNFAVGKQEDAEETAQSVGGNTTTTVQVQTRIGRFMTATLTGGGFDIAGEGTPERDLGATASEIWTWHVTPRQQGPRTLLLTVKVDAVDDDGKRTRITLSSKTVAVNVGVTAADRRRQKIDDVKGLIDDTGSLWPSIEKWLAGLAGVLLVLGLVIWRFKLLGKKPEEPAPKDKPKYGPKP